jgi:hypothetical protein
LREAAARIRLAHESLVQRIVGHTLDHHIRFLESAVELPNKLQRLLSARDAIKLTAGRLEQAQGRVFADPSATNISARDSLLFELFEKKTLFVPSSLSADVDAIIRSNPNIQMQVEFSNIDVESVESTLRSAIDSMGTWENQMKQICPQIFEEMFKKHLLELCFDRISGSRHTCPSCIYPSPLFGQVYKITFLKRTLTLLFSRCSTQHG